MDAGLDGERRRLYGICGQAVRTWRMGAGQGRDGQRRPAEEWIRPSMGWACRWVVCGYGA